jgi:hypothetical protein
MSKEHEMSITKFPVMSVLLLMGCALLAPAVVTSVADAAPVKATNYSKRAHWLHLPDKVKMRVDVFYIYPTAYSRAPGGPTICPVDDPGMMKGAQVAYSRQATAFRNFANMYAPYYRQVDAAYQLSLPPKQQEKIIEGAPATDVIAAFKYYIKHYNHGRPYILAAHSQGSAVLRYLLSDYMKKHPRIYRRMVAAYVVGQSVTRDYLAKNPHLKFTRRANDTGTIISWNTEAPTIAAKNPVTLPGGIAVNPITWTRKTTPAGAGQNLGSIELDPATGGTPVLNEDGTIKRVLGLADARVNAKRGVVICSTVNREDPPYYIPGGFPMGVYHTFDYPFYFFDIRVNAHERVRRFFAEHPAYRR